MALTSQEANGALAARFPGVLQDFGRGAKDAVDIYHAPNSICSQKVRAVLAQKRRSYVSHIMDIFAGDTYDPAYVRVRLSGCRSSSMPLSSAHLGTTSVAASGCDACVVPTWVSDDGQRVVVDSLRIARELDRIDPVAPGGLVPDALAADIDEQISIVDNLPNYQLLAVRVAKSAEGKINNVFAQSKVDRCDKLMADHADDADLCEAYAAKRSKESVAADRLFTEDAMARASVAMADAIASFERQLARADDRYIFGDTITLADLFWAVELVRCEDVGCAHLWAGDRAPHVGAYYMRMCAEPAIAHAVLDWPRARLKSKPV